MSRLSFLLGRVVDHDIPAESAADKERIAKGFFLICSASLFSKLADLLANPKITLTWVMQTLGAPAFTISLLVPIRESGSMLPQLFLAKTVNKYRRKVPLYQFGAVLQGIAILGILVVAALLTGDAAGWLIIMAMIVFSLGRCLCSLVSKTVLGKVIPKSLRGQTMGWAASAAGLISCAVAIALLTQGQLQSLALVCGLLVIACVAWGLAALVYGQIDEPSSDTSEANSDDDNAENTWTQRLRLLKTDSTFSRFVLARALLMSSALVAPYYILLGQSEGSAIGMLGGLLLGSSLAQLCSSTIWGKWSDRSSKQTLQIAGSLVFVLGVVTLSVNAVDKTLFQSVWLLPCVYFILEVAHQGIRLARKTYLVDLGTDDQSRVDYVSVSNSVIGALLLVAGVILGILSLLVNALWLVGILSLLCAAGVIVCRALPDN